MKRLIASIASLVALSSTSFGQEDTNYWYEAGRAAIAKRVAEQPNTKRAKNVILFVGDGIGVSTLTAGRIFDGQAKGMLGEENRLSFEHFPYSGLVATYNVDAQVPDSAGTASALNTGVKTRIGVINTAPEHPQRICDGTLTNRLKPFAEFAESRGMVTGVVSTARITHATPAAVYATSADRNWENDARLPEGADPRKCPDIASQIMGSLGGNGLEVAIGGGRANFLPVDAGGRREDGRNITQEWQDMSRKNVYVDSFQALRSIDPTTDRRVLGLLADSHIPYHLDRAKEDVTLTDMAEFAVKNLEARDAGYYLMIEGGRIDHAHHGGNAKRALAETAEFSRAIARVLELVNTEETLILVTADHSHVFTIAGYARRGNPILGLAVPVRLNKEDTAPELAQDGKPYTTLGYQNGPGFIGSERVDLRDIDTKALNFQQQAAIPTRSETHGGEDVAVYGVGPWAHLARGLLEQNDIYHIMRHAITARE